MIGTCEECSQPDRRVGPFRAGEKRYERICGVCKFRVTLRQPGVKERLQEDAKAIASALAKGPQ